MTLDAARAMDAGGEARVEISLIKFWGARMLHDVIDRAIQVHGALGVTADTPLEAMYREARYARIYDGPDEVHRMNVRPAHPQGSRGQRALGLSADGPPTPLVALLRFGSLPTRSPLSSPARTIIVGSASRSGAAPRLAVRGDGPPRRASASSPPWRRSSLEDLGQLGGHRGAAQVVATPRRTRRSRSRTWSVSAASSTLPVATLFQRSRSVPTASLRRAPRREPHLVERGRRVAGADLAGVDPVVAEVAVGDVAVLVAEQPLALDRRADRTRPAPWRPSRWSRACR